MELKVNDLSKEIEGVRILENINMEIKSGEAVALVGANGAGKTTLLNCILNIYTKYTGEIFLERQNIKDKIDPGIRRKIAFILDTTGLFVPLTAWENIEFYDRLYNPDSSSKERSERLSKIFEKISLKRKEKGRITGFSKGMKQRLAIGRTMVNEPEMIVLDEPYLGLDVEGKCFLTEYLLNLKKRGCTILLSSHDLTEIEKVCDRAVFIKEGRVKDEKRLDHQSDNETRKSELEKMYEKVLM